MTSNFKNKLLLGAAVTALSFGVAGAAQAADLEIDTGGLTSTLTTDNIVNAVDDTDSDVLDTNTAANQAITNVDIDIDGALAVHDTGGAGGDAVAISGYVDILTGKTLTITQGLAATATSDADIAIAGNLGGTVSSTLTRGGTLAIIAADNMAAAQTFAVNGNTYLTAVSVTGGNAGAAAGSAMTATFGDATTDTFNVTGLTVTGGNADAAADTAGGASTVTVNGTATIGATGVTVTGGNGADNAVGGNAALTFADGVTASGAIAVVGGETDTGAGGTGAIEFTSGITSTSTLTLAGATAGTVGTATATTKGNTTFTAISLDDGAANAAATFVAQATTDDTGDFTVTGTIDGGAAGEGTLTVTDSTATTADTVTFASNIGATNALELVEVGDSTVSGGHAVFSGSVAATTVTVGAENTTDDAVTADFNGNVTGAVGILAESDSAVNTTATFAGDVTGAITFTDNGGASVATATFDGTSAQTHTGAVATNDNGEGVLNIGSTGTNSSVTTTGTIGSGAAGLDLITVASGSTWSIDDNVFTNKAGGAGTVAFDVDGTLNVTVADGAVEILEDTSDIDIDGTVNVTGTTNGFDIDAAASDLYFDGTLSTALSTGVTTLDANDDIALAQTSNTTFTAGSNIALTATDDILISDDDGKTLTVAIKKTAAFDPTATDVIDATGDVIIDEDGQLIVTIASGSLEFDAGDTITVIDGDTDVEGATGGATTYAALMTAGDVVLQDTGLIDIQDNSSTAQDLLVTIAYKDATSVFGGGAVGSAGANQLLAIGSAATSGNLETARANLISAATSEAAEEVAESIVSTVDGGNVVAAVNTTNLSAGKVNTQLAALRTGETGMTAGNISQGLRAWTEVFGQTADQDSRDGVDGYEADTLGFTVGIDTETLADRWIWGLAFSYSDTEVDSSNANTTDTEVDTYQLTLYANYDWDERTYITGQLGYAYGENDTTRHNVGGISGLDAAGDFDSNTFTARVEAGRSYDVGSNTKLTPHVLANYVHYDADSYTETGAGTANLTVDPDALNIFEIGVGVDASWLYQQADGAYLKPEVSVGVRHDLVGDEVESSNTFTGGGAAFNTQGFDPAQTSFNAGVGVTYFTTTNWELSAEYDYDIKSDYDAHSGVLRAAYKF